MNCPTVYSLRDTEGFLHAIGAPSVPTGGFIRNWRDDIGAVIERSDWLAGELDEAHEVRHDLNMQEWRRRWQVHIDAGEFDIAANIFNMKIKPNIA